jgi:hypothetical protein
MIMNNENNSSNHKEEETKLIITCLLTDIIMKVLLMRQQHLAKLNRECVRRYREWKQQRNAIEYMRKVQKIDKRVDQIIVIMTCWKVVNRFI